MVRSLGALLVMLAILAFEGVLYWVAGTIASEASSSTARTIILVLFSITLVIFLGLSARGKP